MPTFTILDRKIKRENLPEFTRYLFKNRIKDRRRIMEITKEEFQDYYCVQLSGITNMFNIKLVGELTGISKEKILFIMKNYAELSEKYK